MYNPDGTDSGHEWIEIYSNKTIDLSGWKFYEAGTDHGFTLINGSWIIDGYAVIADEWDTFLSDYPNFNGTLLDSSWTSLSNSGEYIAIENTSLDIIDEINYSAEFANGNGKSLERLGNNWYESLEYMGTPGRENSVIDETQGIDCDLNVIIHTDNTIFENKDEFSFKIIIEKEGEDEADITLFREILNEFGEIIKTYNDLSTTINKKKTLTYSPNLDCGAYLIKTNITYSSCNDIDLDNNYYEKLILIKPQKTSGNSSYSSISINEFLPDPKGDDNAPMPNGEFIELYNKGDNNLDLAGLYFKDSADHKLYITDTTTIDNTIIESEDYLAIYTNEFSGFLNNQGFEEIKLYDPYGNLIDKVTYSNSEESLSWSLVDNIWKYRNPSPNEENPKQEVEMQSHFKILGLEDVGDDNESEFGDTIKVKFYAYKGNTTKSSIKLYIENDEDRISKLTKATLQNKYTNYSLTLPIQIKPNCNEKYQDGDYYVKIGWTSLSQVEDTFKIKLKGINDDNCDKMYVERKPREGTLNHNLLEAPGSVESDKDFKITIELSNGDSVDHNVDLYSYVYRGNKCYSIDREANKKTILVKAGQDKEVELQNIVTEAEPGDYKLKIKVKRDDQKTEKEITQPIKVLEKGIENEADIEKKQEKIELKEKDKEDYSTILESTKHPKTIYESPSIKAQNLIIYLFIGLLVIYAAVLTWKR